MGVAPNCTPKPPPCLQGLAGAVRLGQAIDQVCAAKGDLAVIKGEIPRDGVIIEVAAQPFGDVAKRPFINEQLGQRAQAVQVVQINVIAIGVDLGVKGITPFAHRDDHAGLLIRAPVLGATQEIGKIRLVQSNGLSQFRIQFLAINELDFKLFHGLAQEHAVHARNQALHSLINGGDPLQVGFALSHQGFAAEHKSKQQRQLATPDEIMNMPNDQAVLFHEDVAYPIQIERRPYWTDRSLAGLYHPNPFPPPLDSVKVQTFWGQRTRRVVTEPVPAQYAHYPQYRSGVWSRVEH